MYVCKVFAEPMKTLFNVTFKFHFNPFLLLIQIKTNKILIVTTFHCSKEAYKGTIESYMLVYQNKKKDKLASILQIFAFQRFQPSRFSWKPPVFRDHFRPPSFTSKPPVFLFSLKKSQICYTYSLKSTKNSTSNTSSLKQLKQPERIVKNQDRLSSLWALQMTKRDCNVVENSSCWVKTSQILRQKAPDPP